MTFKFGTTHMEASKLEYPSSRLSTYALQPETLVDCGAFHSAMGVPELLVLK